MTYGIVSAETAQVLQNDPVINGALSTAGGVVVGAATKSGYGLAKK